ncbi:RseA family anti-sigma factor [sulfur-oxidizing endosymbiont of Gigantopelta aegis]|uniref:RseA family anti-sigma factor n=1 Tax=sulfur-oxidizing endosymbiont of Gigantopelta aegis TaxID=2794934 RepID=UPI0018DE3203|nr:RseA family anti-sigma factor [sulfur-oxidizing endosymbiont of Gigantopelta aegis]
MPVQTNEQHANEMLSAFIDAEQSTQETSQVIDALLSDPDFKQQYIRMQSGSDHLHNEVVQSFSMTDLTGNISATLDGLPAHFVDAAVTLQSTETTDVEKLTAWQNLFKKVSENRTLSGLSVAASVMFVTLFALQNVTNLNPDMNSNTDRAVNLASSQLGANNFASNSMQIAPIVNASSVGQSSLIRAANNLPASYVSMNPSFGSVSGNGVNTKQQYKWIEADPALSRQVRQYVNEHERQRAAYNLQPKIRTATYQISQ